MKLLLLLLLCLSVQVPKADEVPLDDEYDDDEGAVGDGMDEYDRGEGAAGGTQDDEFEREYLTLMQVRVHSNSSCCSRLWAASNSSSSSLHTVVVKQQRLQCSRDKCQPCRVPVAMHVRF